MKGLGAPVVAALTALTNASWSLRYFPKCFRRAKTVVLRKEGKESYETASSWRPIALLRTVGKVVEKAFARRLRAVAEENRLLPPEQMGARGERSTTAAVELLTGLVKTVWKGSKGDNVATLLSLDISGAFDTVVHSKLVEIMARMGLPEWAREWVTSFLCERETTLLINGEETEWFRVPAGVPQGSPLSPILFLLYNAELLEICSRPKEALHSIGFVDDINILTYGTTTKGNCLRLGRVHERCLRWAEEHGIAFAPKKYELIHFTAARKRFDLEQSIELGDVVKCPTRQVRVLGVWLDPKLRWSAHATKVRAKGLIAGACFRKIVQSTWGASFSKARVLYNSTVRPVMSYGASAWVSCGESAGLVVNQGRLEQNRCLRAITGGYRATPIRELETEAATAPFEVYAKEQCAQAIRRIYESSVGSFIKSQCLGVATKLWRRKGRRALRPSVPVVVEERVLWAERRKVELGAGRKAVLREWRNRWEASSRRGGRWSVAREQGPGAGQLKLHEGLFKAQSSLLVQLRTGVNGFAHTLARLKVPGVDRWCACRGGIETGEHVLLHCSLEDERRAWSRGTTLAELVSDPLRAKETANWVMRSGRLGQYALARKLLLE